MFPLFKNFFIRLGRSRPNYFLIDRPERARPSIKKQFLNWFKWVILGNEAFSLKSLEIVSLYLFFLPRLRHLIGFVSWRRNRKEKSGIRFHCVNTVISIISAVTAVISKDSEVISPFEITLIQLSLTRQKGFNSGKESRLSIKNFTPGAGKRMPYIQF